MQPRKHSAKQLVPRARSGSTSQICPEAATDMASCRLRILRSAVPKLINAYISGTLRTAFRNPTFLIQPGLCSLIVNKGSLGNCQRGAFSETQKVLGHKKGQG